LRAVQALGITPHHRRSFVHVPRLEGGPAGANLRNAADGVPSRQPTR
jgi:hypothetical protein